MSRPTKNVIRIGLTLTILAAVIWFLHGWGWSATPWNYSHYGYGHEGWMPYGMMVGGGSGLVMILFWIIAGVALVLLISGIWNNQGDRQWGDDTICAPMQRKPDALEILKRRYAGGEIDQTAYEHMKRELE